MANLFSTVLIEAWPVIAKALAPDGDLIVSGILATQAWEVFTAAAANGLGFTKVITKGKWVTARGGHLEDLIAKAKIADPRQTGLFIVARAMQHPAPCPLRCFTNPIATRRCANTRSVSRMNTPPPLSLATSRASPSPATARCRTASPQR